jgi:hypothetical protein
MMRHALERGLSLNLFNRVLAMTGEELEETEIPGFDLESQTLFCGNVVGDHLLQVNFINNECKYYVTHYFKGDKQRNSFGVVHNDDFG